MYHGSNRIYFTQVAIQLFLYSQTIRYLILITVAIQNQRLKASISSIRKKAIATKMVPLSSVPNITLSQWAI